MTLVWAIYIISACIVAGIFALLVRIDIRKGKVVEITLPEILVTAFLVLMPWLNAAVACFMIWYYISEHGGDHVMTFGKDKD